MSAAPCDEDLSVLRHTGAGRALRENRSFMNNNLSPHELAKAYLNQMRGLTAASEFNSLFFLENLILEQPENAWPVFLELLWQPLSDEELEQVSIRLELLLSYHLEIFHPRVVALVQGHAELPRFLPPTKLERARYIRVAG